MLPRFDTTGSSDGTTRITGADWNALVDVVESLQEQVRTLQALAVDGRDLPRIIRDALLLADLVV